MTFNSYLFSHFLAPKFRVQDPIITQVNATVVNITFHKQTALYKWRGLKKYLRIRVEGTPKQTSNPDDLITEDYDYLNTGIPHDNILYPIDRTKNDYWLFKYDYHIEFDYSFDNITNSTIPCNNTLINLYKSQETSFTLFLHKLHPYTQYKVKYRPCNEIKCSPHVKTVYEFMTGAYKPSQAPYNVTVNAVGKTDLKVNWSLIDEFHQNGKIRGHLLIVNITRTNLTFVKNVTANFTNVLFGNIGKYEQACIKIAAYTDYHDVGPFSNETCAYTNESGKFAINTIYILIFFCITIYSCRYNAMKRTVRREMFQTFTENSQENNYEGVHFHIKPVLFSKTVQ